MISVIVPAYNVENYIDKCINSLLKQTFQDYEIIVVDDGSTDSTGTIVDKYLLKDRRVRVFHKENGGLSDARNYGMRYAQGDFFTFVDSDDYVNIEFLQLLMDMIRKESNIDISMLPIKYVYDEDRDYIGDVSEQKDFHIYDPEQIIEKMLLRETYNHCGVGKLYKRELWDNFEFPVGRLYEDYLTTYRVFSKSNKIICSPTPLYYYLQRNDSIMHYKVSGRTLSLLDVADEVASFLIEKYPKSECAILDHQASSYLKTLQLILNEGFETHMTEQKRILGFIKSIRWKLLLSNTVPTKDKIKMMTLWGGKNIFLKVYNIANT